MPNQQGGAAPPPNRADRRHPPSEVAQHLAQDPLAGKLLVSVPEACEILSLSRSRIYRMIQTGDIRSVTVGRRRMIAADAIRCFVAGLEAA